MNIFEKWAILTVVLFMLYVIKAEANKQAEWVSVCHTIATGVIMAGFSVNTGFAVAKFIIIIWELAS